MVFCARLTEYTSQARRKEHSKFNGDGQSSRTPIHMKNKPSVKRLLFTVFKYCTVPVL